jgi:hypothetical protein
MPSAKRVAQNESFFREVNERIHELEERFGARAAGADLPSFVCECTTTGCAVAVPMSVEEYRLVREKPTRFLVAPGHSHSGAERVVQRTARFEIVERPGATRAIAADEAPTYEAMRSKPDLRRRPRP